MQRPIVHAFGQIFCGNFPYTAEFAFLRPLSMLFALRYLLLSICFVVACCLDVVVVLLRPFHRDNTRICARMFALPGVRILGLRLQIDLSALPDHGAQKPVAHVAILNHQSNLDVFVLGCAVTRNTVTVGKDSLRWLPIFGQIYWLAGSVLVDRGNALKAKAAMLKTTDVLKHQGTSIWIMPEGTRNHGKGLLPFKKGAFLTAINAGAPIVPVCCSNFKRDMRLNRWHSGAVRVRALPPIATAGLSSADIPALMARCRSDMLTCIEELDAACAKDNAAMWG